MSLSGLIGELYIDIIEDTATRAVHINDGSFAGHFAGSSTYQDDLPGGVVGYSGTIGVHISDAFDSYIASNSGVTSVSDIDTAYIDGIISSTINNSMANIGTSAHTAIDIALAAVEAGTAAGIAAGLDEGTARDAAQEAVEEETGISREILEAAAAAR